MDSSQHTPKATARTKVGRILIRLAIIALLFYGFYFLLNEYLVDAYGIPSGSMETTIMTGDKVFAEQVSYHFSEVRSGDIISFEDPEDPNRILIKRCIAVGGQVVDLFEGQVYIDGVPLTESYTEGKLTEPFLGETALDINYPYTIPAGHLWVMGDNRTNSQDSRYFGAIDASTVYARAMLVYWPIEHISFL